MGKNILIQQFFIAIIILLFYNMPITYATVSENGGEYTVTRLTSTSPLSSASPNSISLHQIKPRYLRKADRETTRRERKMKRDYNDAIRENQRRSIEIQTPEVQERMKMNKKNAAANYRAKRKENRARSRDAARKYN